MKAHSIIPKAVLVATIALLTSAPAVPQDDSDASRDVQETEQPADGELRFEEKIEVVAPPIIEGNSVDRYANTTTTISQLQIRDLAAQDPQTALRRTPGVVISRHNPVGSFGGGEGGAIYIRGMGSSRPGGEVQALVDGVPIFVGVWTHPLMDVLSIDLADHIDVHKGASGVLVGNGTFGAVNLVPKRRTEEGVEGRLNAALGSYSSGTGVAELGGRHDALDYYVVGSYRRSDGHREGADGRLAAFSGRLGYQLASSWNASFYLSRTDNEASDPGPEDGSLPPDGLYKVDDWLGILKLTNEYENAFGDLRIYWNRGDIDWLGQFNETTGQNDEDTLTDYVNWGVRARQTFEPWSGGELVAGLDWDTISGDVDFRSGSAPPSRFEKTEFRITAPFAALSHRLTLSADWDLTPSAGVRYHSHNEFADEVSWQAGLVAARGKTQLHASYGRTVNYPGIYVVVQDEQFLPGDNGWRDLKAEVINHAEVGIAVALGDLKADVTLYRDALRNRIVIVPPPPFPPRLSNVGSYSSHGVETTLAWTPARQMAVFAGFNWLDADRKLPYVPEWTATVGLSLRPLSRLDINLDAQYVDEQLVGSLGRAAGYELFQPVGSYSLLNGRVGYRLDGPGTASTQLYVFVENLTDERYELKKSYPMPGINARAGLNLTF